MFVVASNIARDSPAQRVDALLPKLLKDEIIQQTWSPYGGSAESLLKKLGKNGVGQISYKSAGGSTLFERVDGRNKLQQQIMKASTHGIPASFSCESLHSAVIGGTVFPELVTQGATWDVELIEEIGAAIATEATAW